MRRPGPATAVAVLFALSAVSDAGNLIAWVAAGRPGPAALTLVHVPAGLLAAGVATGAWRRARWAAPAAAVWGVLGAAAALVLGPHVPPPADLPPEARAALPAILPLALGVAAAALLALGLGAAAYLRRVAGARPTA